MNIKNKITEEIQRLGSQAAVANKCGVSPSAISRYMNGEYGADTKKLEDSIVIGLGIVNDTWQIANTRDIQKLHAVYSTSKANSVFVAISEKAGSGKSASVNTYAKKTNNVYVVRAREWTSKQFLDEIVRVLGIALPSGYVTIDAKINKICAFFKERRDRKCQLIVDEADKLRPTALRVLIPIYNECEGLLSVAITGTENLSKEIKRGVKYARKGYDEIDSRFGRRYIATTGATKADVSAICRANGVVDAEKAEKIWKACPKIRKKIEERDITVVADLRLLKNLILFG